MWILDADIAIDVLTPAEQLWIVELAMEENGGPSDYVATLRQLAERLDEMCWWLSDQHYSDC